MSDGKIKVMVVDDSAVIRGFLSRYLKEDDMIDVVCSAYNGIVALKNMDRYDLDVIILDIEMPEMDGMTALPLILEKDKNVQVIIASTLTQRNADITLKALQIGAAECLAKPTSAELNTSDNFKRDLIEKTKALGLYSNRKKGIKLNPVISDKKPDSNKIIINDGEVKLRLEKYRGHIDAIAIGSSTGGPQALTNVITNLKCHKITQPIFITQHMPATFTKILAANLQKVSDIECKEAEHDEIVRGGVIYIAPGDYHMLIEKDGLNKKIVLNQEAPENFCRPSVDPMLRSLNSAYGNKILMVMLTGMGHDGLDETTKLAGIDANIIAQNRETSVVWGMPGAIAVKGLCNKILPLDEIATNIISYAKR